MNDQAVEIQIELLAREIARQNSPTSALSTASSSPREIARALYLQGWQPPAVPSPERSE